MDLVAIHNLILEGKLDEAMKSFSSTLPKEHSYHQNILQLQFRLRELNNDKRNGVIELKEFRIEKNRISTDFVNLINDFRINLQNKNTNQIEVDSKSNSKRTILHNFTIGIRGYLLIVSLLVLIILGFVSGVFKGSNEFNSLDMSFLTPDEQDIMDEWVILIKTSNSKEEIKDCFNYFMDAYMISNHKKFSERIHWGRHPNNRGEWILVVDPVLGKGTMKDASSAIEEMFSLDSLINLALSQDDDIGLDQNIEWNKLSFILHAPDWIKDAAPFKYSRDSFEKTYGEIRRNRQ